MPVSATSAWGSVMPRRSWVYVNGVAYERGVDAIPETEGTRSTAILPDLPDFVSPVDGSIVSGRAGLREHNLRNNVVNTLDLAGLPNQTMTSDMRSSSEKRRDADHRRESIARQIYNR